MTPNPFTALLHSRKFWLAILDAFLGSLSLVLAWFLSPDKVTSILTLFGLWQPVILIVIYSIASEDNANTKAVTEKYKADQSLTESKFMYSQPTSPPVPPVVVNTSSFPTQPQS